MSNKYRKGGASGGAIYARYRPLKKISVLDLKVMFGIFSQYYDGGDLETFIQDMGNKSGVIVLRRKRDRQIVGFSTITRYPIKLKNGRTAYGIFSGDTIIQREYWGSRALQVRFFLHVLAQRFKHPLAPLYWLLISKGYKTYLLLANNFPSGYYYPSEECYRGDLQQVVDDYCEQLFPGYFDRERHLLDFGQDYQKLKQGVADISLEMRQRFPSIEFFERINPTWQQGTELPCVGDLSFVVLARYVVVLCKKLWVKRSSKQSVASTESLAASEGDNG